MLYQQAEARSPAGEAESERRERVTLEKEALLGGSVVVLGQKVPGRGQRAGPNQGCRTCRRGLAENACPPGHCGHHASGSLESDEGAPGIRRSKDTKDGKHPRQTALPRSPLCQTSSSHVQPEPPAPPHMSHTFLGELGQAS